MATRRMSGGHSSMVMSAAAAALLLLSCRESTPASPPAHAKPEVFLLTALPLVWSETFGLDQPGSPALQAIEAGYRVKPVDLPSQLPDGALLLAAQPRALPAEELVALDKWIRRGGRMVLLADPMLEWPSELPLGDRRRAPVIFADTGLLQHWGLRLDAPDDRGPKQLTLAGKPILTASPGTLTRTAGSCVVAADGLAAKCSFGKGAAAIVADADFLNLGPGGLDGPTDNNLPALLSELAAVSR
jgi:hypothetical protein